MTEAMNYLHRAKVRGVVFSEVEIMTIAAVCQKVDGASQLRLAHAVEALEYQSLEGLRTIAASHDYGNVQERARRVLEAVAGNQN